VGVIAAIVFAALPLTPPPLFTGETVDSDEPALELHVRAVGERSKKESWLVDKATRPNVHMTDAALAQAARPRPAVRAARGPICSTLAPAGEPLPGSRIAPVTTLFNLRTREVLPLLPGLSAEPGWSPFLRDHYTNQAAPQMDPRLIEVLSQTAQHFSAARIEVVSGYRSPKFNLMLRKKGREVARSSQHTEGHAVDFRIRGVPTKTLLKFVRSLRVGGVGYYPQSQFVHSDTGPIRYWKGT
jgi:hypothetical protein